MLDSVELVLTAIEENILDAPPMVSAAEIWSLVVKSQKLYGCKYTRCGEGSKSTEKKQRSRSRS